MAGILHDILEDTGAQIDSVSKEFGNEVAGLVEANSFDQSIDDWDQQYVDGFARCLAHGADAVRVKAADVIDNVPYYDLGSLRKPKYFRDLARRRL